MDYEHSICIMSSRAHVRHNSDGKIMAAMLQCLAFAITSILLPLPATLPRYQKGTYGGPLEYNCVSCLQAVWDVVWRRIVNTGACKKNARHPRFKSQTHVRKIKV